MANTQAKKKTLVPDEEDYARIDRAIGKLDPGQFYTVVTHRIRGKFRRSIHIFAKQPTKSQLLKFEDASSKVRVRGRHTEFEGSQVQAYSDLYDALIVRGYDIPDGFTILGEIETDEKDEPYPDQKGISKEQCIEVVSPVTKREALRDQVGEVYSEARVAEMEGTPDRDAKSKEED